MLSIYSIRLIMEDFATPPSSPPPITSDELAERIKQSLDELGKSKKIDELRQYPNYNVDLEEDGETVETLKDYLSVVQKLPDNLAFDNMKDIKSEIKSLKKSAQNDPDQLQIVDEIERTLNDKVGNTKKGKKRKINETPFDDPLLKQPKISNFEKLRLNTKSILNIQSQSNVLINGITKSGKSTFIANLFSPEFWSFGQMISNVYLFSKIDVQEAWINLQKNCQNLGIKLHIYRTIDTLPDLQKIIPKQSVLIVDDFMVDAIKDKKLMNLLTDLFNVTTHHNDIISIFTLHNLFVDGFRTMRLNSEYIFLFSNPVDVNSVKVFFRQLENEQKAQLLFIAYKKALSDSQSFGIQIKKNLNHNFYYGFSNLIMFVTDTELKDIEAKYTLTNDGVAT